MNSGVSENIVVLAGPFFVFCILIEFAVMRIRKQDFYRLGDAINSVSCGILDQVVNAVVGLGPAILLYSTVHRYAFFDWDAHSGWTWIVALVLADFFYYWWHRMSHKVNFMWAAHVVHHQSEDYNLSTALRQSWPATVTSAFFFLPMALIGIPFEIYFQSVGINLLYQFWIHTQVINRLGPLEWVLNTPSHHRAHHGVNPEYIDKNFAGILIIWDRFFGTFEEERAPVQYGVIKPVDTWNPVSNNFVHWRELVRRSRAEKGGVVAALKHWIVSPEWTPSNPAPPLVLSAYRPEGYRKYERFYSSRQIAVIIVAFTSIVAASVVFLLMQNRIPLWARGGYLVAVTLALVTVNGVGRAASTSHEP